MDHKNTQKSPLIKTYVYQLFLKFLFYFFLMKPVMEKNNLLLKKKLKFPSSVSGLQVLKQNAGLTDN